VIEKAHSRWAPLQSDIAALDDVKNIVFHITVIQKRRRIGKKLLNNN